MNSMNLMINTQANPASADSRQSGKQAQLPDFSFESKLAQQTQAQPLTSKVQNAGQQAKAPVQQSAAADVSVDAQAISKLPATQGDTAKADVVQTAATAVDAALSDKQLKALEELAVQVAAAPNAKRGEKDTSEWQQMLALLQMVLGPQVSQLLTDNGAESPSGQLLTQLQQSAAQAAQQTPVGMEKLLTLLQPLAADSKEAQQMQAWVQQVLHLPTTDAAATLRQTGQPMQLAELLQQLQTVPQGNQPASASAKLLQALQQPATQQQVASMAADVRQPVKGALAQLTAAMQAQPQTAMQAQQSVQPTAVLQTAVQAQQPVQLVATGQAQPQMTAPVQLAATEQAQQPGSQAVLPEAQPETAAVAEQLQNAASSQPLTAAAATTVHTVLAQQPLATAAAATQQRVTDTVPTTQLQQAPAVDPETMQPVAAMPSPQAGSQSMTQSGEDESSLFQQQARTALPSDTPLTQEAESAPTPGMSHEATAAAGSSSFATQLQQVAQPEAQAAQAAPAPVQQDYDVPQQILSQARLIRRGQDTQMVIHLHPEHLGDLTLKVAVGVDGAVNASFHSNNAEVRTIIQNSLAALRQDLNNQGLRVDNVDVYAGLDGGLPQQDSGQQGWQQQGGQQQSTASGHAQAYADEKELHEAALQQTAATAAPQPATATGAVDYRV
ncbi:MAG: flagellar hook-length control protein FliK [Selenomonadaceae bacterium]|nr:flagellar hook-length control protein FliK [Selenomonadaceae bacterium]